jgi:hypothetical protein
MRFSDAHGIEAKKADDWFDPVLDRDTALFVDPFLIFQDTRQAWSGVHGELVAYFNSCFQLIAEGNMNPRSVQYRKALGLLRFPEPSEFCLGYTSRGTRGAGTGVGHARLMARAMADAINRGLDDIRHFEELGILSEGIGPDRISDITCNLLRLRFAGYTEAIAKRHGVPVQPFRLRRGVFNRRMKQWSPEVARLPISPLDNKPVVLVPERFLRDLPVLNAYDWFEYYEGTQLRADLNYEVMQSLPKRKIVALARRNPRMVRDYVRTKEKSKARAYDFGRDPLGVDAWHEASLAFVRSNPLVLKPPSTVREFRDAVQLVVDRFTHFIEEQRGWELLWNDDESEKPERAIQILFYGVARAYCEANNIVVDREIELGKGPVDFKFSNGYSRRCLLEVKKLSNGKFWNGLESQLPSYMSSDQCRDGWFLAVRFQSSKAQLKRASDVAGEVSRVAKKLSLTLRHGVVDATPKVSASKLKST